MKNILFRIALGLVTMFFIFCPISPIFAEIGRAEDGAVVENSTHVESRVNPKTGDFLWELEGKPAPKYPLQEGAKVVGRYGSEESVDR